MNRRKGKKGNKIKISIILMCLITTIILMVNSILAFFSDVVSDTTTLVAGTLDLVASAKFYINDSIDEATETELACINPGDKVKIVISAENEGSKSAWLMSELTITSQAKDGTYFNAAQLSSVFSVTDADSTPLTPASETNAVTFASDQVILDGTFEKETGSAAVGEVSAETIFYIFFAAEVDNTWQNTCISIEYRVKALQYRNNAAPDWSSAVALD